MYKNKPRPLLGLTHCFSPSISSSSFLTASLSSSIPLYPSHSLPLSRHLFLPLSQSYSSLCLGLPAPLSSFFSAIFSSSFLTLSSHSLFSFFSSSSLPLHPSLSQTSTPRRCRPCWRGTWRGRWRCRCLPRDARWWCRPPWTPTRLQVTRHTPANTPLYSVRPHPRTS